MRDIELPVASAARNAHVSRFRNDVAIGLHKTTGGISMTQVSGRFHIGIEVSEDIWFDSLTEMPTSQELIAL